jgi:membrane-bound serine protease (ClpP class)
VLAELLRFVSDPSISGVLLAVGLASLLIEMQTLHLVAGAVGVAAFALFFGSHIFVGSADSLIACLAAIGLAGIVLELHIVPGHGVPGVLGLATLFTAIVFAFGFPFGFVAVQSLAIAVVLTTTIFFFAARVFPQNAFMHRLTFTGVQGRDYVAAPDYRALIGQAGFATSFLRPAGYAAINGQKVDVLTEGEFVAAGTPLVVTRVEGARVFVRPRSEPMPKSWKRS